MGRIEVSDQITHRYRTKIVVRVDSHVSGMVDLSDDCIALTTEKTTKATGKLQFQLVPRRNYLNLIYPDDVVNIYIDPGDDQNTGMTRVMFGYIDRVDRSESTSADGAMETVFTVIGSDFQKAFDKTSIYFNEYMRQILDERFVRTGAGQERQTFSQLSTGIALRQAGISAHGTPADFVSNFIEILTGFGKQWVLPQSYAAKIDKAASRDARIQRAKNRLPPDIYARIGNIGGKPDEILKQIEEQLNKDNDLLKKGKVDAQGKAELKAANDEYEKAKRLLGSQELKAYLTQLINADARRSAGISDLLCLDFIEAAAIDGYLVDVPVWQAGNQTLTQFLYGHSNELVNELIVDLRPSTGGRNPAYGTNYSYDLDDVGMNRGSGIDNPGVCYVPAVIFREYPWSVIKEMSVAGTFDIDVDANSALANTPIRFGPVFAQGVNRTGRHLYTYPEALAPTDANVSGDPIKAIDSVTIRNTDVISSQLGRSDEDVSNLQQLFGQTINGTADFYRSWLSNYQPVVNQLSIARHGLRVRELISEFSSYYGTAAVESRHARRNLVRWQLLLDHWFQHNIEYLSGTITLRGMPNIRVGYRLDWYDRNESYYVESVQHHWAYGQPFITTLSVSRGQRNDPFPAYIPPVFLNPAGTERNVVASGNRSEDGRLAIFFDVADTRATVNAVDGKGPSSLKMPNFIDSPPNAACGGHAVYATSEGDFLPSSDELDKAKQDELVKLIYAQKAGRIWR